MTKEQLTAKLCDGLLFILEEVDHDHDVEVHGPGLRAHKQPDIEVRYPGKRFRVLVEEVPPNA
jgi:hypothetical protein